MTLQQLEYILALDKTRHFVRAAEMCGVTQPTLSAMIQKLEDELDCKIFDRSTHPIVPTQVGETIIRKAMTVIQNVNHLKESINSIKGDVSGNLSLAIIPTVAPYLLPGIISEFKNTYKDVNLRLSEMRTSTIIDKLATGELDMAILATPLDNNELLEVPLYYEKFVAYISPNEPLYQEQEIVGMQMPSDKMWVLEEGHCLRSQVFNFCHTMQYSTTYEAGSIDTLVKIVDFNGGYTIIPELHVEFLSEIQKQHIREIVKPEATREISLVFRQDYVREGLMNAVAEAVKKVIPQHMLDARLKKFAIKL